MAGVNDTTRGCLRTGSGAMNLAYLADGKFGGCWGHANKLWDVGAGLLLAELAGAKVSIREVDRSKHLVSYIAAVPSAWEFLYKKASKILELNTITNQA
jgi:fructose-1,6-bisphosphatase/inositol monophosphatase family enzyme